MKIFLIRRSDKADYDTYKSAVVVAESRASARYIHPGKAVWIKEQDKWGFEHEGTPINTFDDLANLEWVHPRDVKVTFVSDFNGRKEDFIFFPVLHTDFLEG